MQRIFNWVVGYVACAALFFGPFLYSVQKERLAYVNMTWVEWLWLQAAKLIQ